MMSILRELRHLPGWRSDRRYVAFAVDDYGTVRLANAKARDHLRQAIPGFRGQMDNFDCLESREDLEALFDVLSCHSDSQGRHPVFTAYCLTANPDFDHLRQNREYNYETLLQTFERASAESPAYEKAWSAWQQGMRACLIRPQFHGREHFNVPLINSKLARNTPDIEANLAAQSMAGLTASPEFPGIDFSQAFALRDTSELPQQRAIIAEGLRLFEQIFGFPSWTFTPPSLKLHASHEPYVRDLGVKSIDKPLKGRQPSGNGKQRRTINFLTPPREGRVGKLVRTLSFEPCSGSKSDPIGHALREIESAFRWKKPAIISSHRVNYVGHIDPDNRRRGLAALGDLIKKLLRRWPDVQFVTVDELVSLMEESISGSSGQVK